MPSLRRACHQHLPPSLSLSKAEELSALLDATLLQGRPAAATALAACGDESSVAEMRTLLARCARWTHEVDDHAHATHMPRTQHATHAPHARAVHMPCTCHAQSMHMPCTGRRPHHALLGGPGRTHRARGGRARRRRRAQRAARRAAARRRARHDEVRVQVAAALGRRAQLRAIWRGGAHLLPAAHPPPRRGGAVALRHRQLGLLDPRARQCALRCGRGRRAERARAALRLLRVGAVRPCDGEVRAAVDVARAVDGADVRDGQRVRLA